MVSIEGPLHGIPYGLKDIISVPEYKTTWGSKSFKNQAIDMEAWVYIRGNIYDKCKSTTSNYVCVSKILFIVDDVIQHRLKSAGAVLVAKLVCGSLAYDDIWFGGRTRNPWNIEEFSTGSSAGPAASTSAGTFQLSSVNVCTFVSVFLQSFLSLIHACSYWIIFRGPFHYIVYFRGQNVLKILFWFSLYTGHVCYSIM